jgi:hypothetical protein
MGGAPSRLRIVPLEVNPSMSSRSVAAPRQPQKMLRRWRLRQRTVSIPLSERSMVPDGGGMSGDAAAPAAAQQKKS